ncbi:MAG: hypothetical protein U0271_24165 [Polyangiaceae bacterium]
MSPLSLARWAPLSLAAFAACMPTPQPTTAPIGRSETAHHPIRRELSGPPGLPAVVLVSAKVDPPAAAYAFNDKAGLGVFTEDGHVWSRILDPKDLETIGDPVDLGAAANIGVAFSLKALADHTFLLLFDESVDQNHVFKVLHLGADGRALGAPLSLPPIAEILRYADLATFGDRAMFLYEALHDGRSTVHVIPIAQGFTSAGAARVALADPVSWYAAQGEHGVGFVSIEADRATLGATPASGELVSVVVAADGTVGAPTTLVSGNSASVDVQIAAIRGGFIVGWTDTSLEDGAARLATLREDGAIAAAPRRVAAPIGRQAFVALASQPTGSGARALVAWENVGQAAGTSRVVQLATVGVDGAISKERTRLLLDDTWTPDLVADGDGFAALTIAPAHTREQAADNAPRWPTVVRLGADLSVRWAEPLRFVGVRSPDGVPDLAWSFTCNGELGCFALASDEAARRVVHLVGTTPRESTWAAPAWPADAERPPRVTALRTIVEGPRFAAAAVAPMGDSELYAWVTYFLEGTTPTDKPPKGEPPYAATLGARFVGKDGPLGDAAFLSRRASSLGSVSIASVASKKPEAVLAWIAEDASGPQVYVTKVDDTGKKVAQKKLTVVGRDGAKSDDGEAKPKKSKKSKDAPADEPSAPSAGRFGSWAASASIANSPALDSKAGSTDGYVVTWVDTRDGNGELYAARINRDLEKTVVDKRITTSKGDAAETSIVVRNGEAFIAFADARDGAAADIYFAHLDAFSLREIDDDGRVYASNANSRAPRLTLVGSNKLLLAWIEEGAEQKGSTLRMAEVDPMGRLVGSPQIVNAPDGGSVTAFALTCGASLDTCRVALSWATRAGLVELGAAALDAHGAVTELVRLGSLTSGPYAEPLFAFGGQNGSLLYFAEDLGDAGRIRQVELSW